MSTDKKYTKFIFYKYKNLPKSYRIPYRSKYTEIHPTIIFYRKTYEIHFKISPLRNKKNTKIHHATILIDKEKTYEIHPKK